jgi:hypothetical protein
MCWRLGIINKMKSIKAVWIPTANCGIFFSITLLIYIFLALPFYCSFLYVLKTTPLYFIVEIFLLCFFYFYCVPANLTNKVSVGRRERCLF